MVMKTLLTQSMEAIAHQGDDGFFRSLTEAVNYIRDNEDRFNKDEIRKIIEESEIESTIMAHTGLLVNFSVNPDIGFNAFAKPELIDPNHILGNQFRSTKAEMTIDRKLKKIKDDYVGIVDLENGRVEGAFSKLVVPIAVGVHLLLARDQETRYLFNDDEVAAIVLHEIGHAFTFFEFVGNQVVMTHTLGETAREFSGSTTPKRKIEIAKAVKKTLEIDDLDEEAFGEIDDEATYVSLVVGLYDKNRRISANQTDFYDTSVVEAVAEQFTVRYGAGRANVTGLDKLHRILGITSHNRSQRFARNLVRYVSILLPAILYTVLTLGVGLILLLPFMAMAIARNLEPRNHEPTLDTMKRIREDMVKELKDSTLTREDRKRIQEDLEAVDKVMEQVYEHRHYVSEFFGKVLPGIRKGTRQKKVIQRLETLDANNLYKHSNDFLLVEGD